jgi:hypothetical protein
MKTHRRALVFLGLLVVAAVAHAGGPRFISPPPNDYWLAFYNPVYYTDPGDLSATVTAAQADAMVAVAASVWNVPPTTLVLAQGGHLDEHVSSANTYFDGTSIVFPADLQSTNLAKPIAIIYDTDGSITDLLLGQGASDPASCRLNGVVESVDHISIYATSHAIIVLNGRCIDSPADRPQQLLQMQYQLTRAFGRVLGLAWSQLSDNVFTGYPYPTLAQVNNWPIMHPIDIICGPYSYQCITNPFTLRDDDIAALALPYYNGAYTAPPAPKQVTPFDAVYLYGNVSFPTGQSTELVNLTVTRRLTTETFWETIPLVSAVTGIRFQQNGGNPVTGPEPDALNAGGNVAAYEGAYYIAWIPIGPVGASLNVTTESIDPLYIGEYTIAPYQRPTITQPGSQTTGEAIGIWTGNINRELDLNLPNAPNSCNPGNDGSEAGPATADPSGWWSGLICGVGHSSWFTTTIRANHTWTLEATALNATGQPTINALQPVLGVWNASDPTGTLPTVAAVGYAMNSLNFGMTQLHVPAPTADTPIRLTVADQYGAGRPDFPYTGRILYADSVAPTNVSSKGGQITITGMGFRKGNTVQIDGKPATVLSWTSTQIVAVAPAHAASATPVDVLVTDPSTGGTTDMPSALTYITAATIQAVAITPTSAYLAAGASAQWTVSLTATQNGLPAATTPVTWSNSSTLTLSAAQTSTSAAGLATVTVQTGPIAAGSTGTVTGCAWTSVCATWTVYGIDPSQWRITPTSGAGQTLALGIPPAPINLQVTDAAGNPLPGALVTLYQTDYAWEAACPVATTARCPSAPVLATSKTTAVSDTDGLITVTPLLTPNTPQTLAIAAVTGTSGFATTTLTLHP